nr:hypothetical protein Iba_scaffold26227CG0020 [Ipomoea batatas]
METNILCLSELTFPFLLQPSQPLTFETLQALLKCQNMKMMKYKNKDGIFNRHTADLSLVSSPIGRHPSGRSVSQVSSQFALRRWLTARLVACDSVTSPLPTAKRTPVRPVAVGSRSQVPPPGLPQFCEDRNNASHLSASRTPDALRRRLSYKNVAPNETGHHLQRPNEIDIVSDDEDDEFVKAKAKAKGLFSSQIVKFKFGKAHEKIAQSTLAGAKSSSHSLLPQRKAYQFCNENGQTVTASASDLKQHPPTHCFAEEREAVK